MKINYEILTAMAPNIIFAAVMLVIVIWGACAIRRDMKKLQQRRDDEMKKAEAMKLVSEINNVQNLTAIASAANRPKKKEKWRQAHG